MSEDLIAKYMKLFEEYNEMYDTYELCDSHWDNDILYWLEPALELKLDEIYAIEKKLIDSGLLILPFNRRTFK